MVPYIHLNQPLKRHLDRFRRFCIAHPCAQNTLTDRHTHTDHARCDICSNRSHLCTARRRCVIKILEHSQQQVTRHCATTGQLLLHYAEIDRISVSSSDSAYLGYLVADNAYAPKYNIYICNLSMTKKWHSRSKPSFIMLWWFGVYDYDYWPT